jgi:hypothetical protein
MPERAMETREEYDGRGPEARTDVGDGWWCILTSMSRVQAVTFSGLMLLIREPLEDMVKLEQFACGNLVVCQEEKETDGRSMIGNKRLGCS